MKGVVCVKNYLWIEINDDVDSLMLWKLIEKYKLNLTQTDTKCWIYGECDFTTVGCVVAKCALFGDLRCEIRRLK